jgi:hypothetical protein
MLVFRDEGLLGGITAAATIHAPRDLPRPESRGFDPASNLARKSGVMSMLVVAATLFIAVTPSGAGAGDRPNPTRLWREFPLRPGTTEPLHTTSDASTSSRPAQTPPGAANPDVEGRSGSLLAVLALAGGGAVAVVLLALLFTRIGPTTKGVSTMSNFMRRRSEGQPEPKSETRTRIPSRIDEAVMSYTLDAAGNDASAHEAREPDAADVRGIMSFDELGQTVANVLRSAQDNAAHVIAAARAQANSMLDAAEAEAKEARAKLDAEMAERRSESEKIRADANRYSEERHRQADSEAIQVRADAEADARRLRETGEATRRNLEEKGLARRQELIEASSTMEARLQDTLTTCQEVVVKIQELLENGQAELVEQARAEDAGDAEDAYAEVFAKAPQEEAQEEEDAELDEELLQEARETERQRETNKQKA